MLSEPACALGALLSLGLAFNVAGCSGGSSVTPDASSLMDGSGGADACAPVNVTMTQPIPSIVFVVSQAGGLTNDLVPGTTKWEAIYDVLMDPTDGVLARYDSVARFGLELFTFSSSVDDGSCPEVASFMPPTLGARMGVDAVYSVESPGVNNPLGDAMAALLPGFQSFAEPGPKTMVILLAGNPDRCADLADHGATSEQLATDAASTAFAMSIGTRIVGVGDQVGTQFLRDMGNAGVGNPYPQPAGPYELANTPAELEIALDSVVASLRSCEFSITPAVSLSDADRGTLRLNGGMLVHGVDWAASASDELALLGTACETYRSDARATVQASFPCAATLP